MRDFQGTEIMHNLFIGSYDGKKRLFTKSGYPPHYGERKIGDLREWMPQRSKLGALFLKGKIVRFERDMKVLYLGCASGTTASHLSDIIDRGILYCVEYSAKPFQKFLKLAMERKNIIPIFGDASKPENYSGIVEKVDFIYQDIAQRNQVEIFVRNFEFFGRQGSEGLIFVKARSIDSARDPEEVYSDVIEKLESHFKILNKGDLLPYHKDHIYIHSRWRG